MAGSEWGRARLLPLVVLALAVLAILAVVSSGGSEPSLAAAPSGSWWDVSYAHRVQLTVTTGANDPFNGYGGYSASATVDTAALVTAGRLQSDCDDLRVVRWNGAAWDELDRDLYSCNSALTELWFKLQAGIAASSSDDNYYLYYDNAGATAAPSNRSQVYLHYNDWSSDTLAQYAVGRQDDWIGTGTYTGFTWNSIDQRVDFDTGAGATGGLRLGTFGERDVYIEQLVRYTNCYAPDVTQGPMARYSGDGTSSDNYYAFVQASSDGCDVAPYSSPAVQKDTRTDTGICAGAGGELALDGSTHRQAFAIWGAGSTNLTGWIDATPRKPSETPDVTCADSTDHQNAGDVAWTFAQVAGSVDDLLVRRYTSPEPSIAIGVEEEPATATPTPTITDTPTDTPTATATDTPTNTPTDTPTDTPT
ncbi:MAG: hypothetical protein WEB04_02200, partial [Dehalococcoidia bacterium]